GNRRSSEDLAREIEEARDRMLAAKRAAKQSEEPIGKRREEQNVKASAQQLQFASATTTAEVDERRMQELQSDIADMRLLLEQQLWRMTDQQQHLPRQINMP